MVWMIGATILAFVAYLGVTVGLPLLYLLLGAVQT